VRWQIKEVGREVVEVPLKEVEGGHFRGYRSEEGKTKKTRSHEALQVGLRPHKNGEAGGCWAGWRRI